MTLVTVRPDGNLDVSGPVTGAGSVQAALADDSDGSYIGYTGTSSPNFTAQLTFPTPSLPAGAVRKRLQFRVRVGSPLNFGELVATGYLSVGGKKVAAGSPVVTWFSPTTITLPGGFDAPEGSLDGFFVEVYASSGATRLYEVYADLVCVVRPVTDVTGPTGTVSTTNQPTVAWAGTLDADGGPQDRYEVRVFAASQYGAGAFSPASSPATVETSAAGGAASWQTPVLPDGDYRAYVRVAQSVNGASHWSDWDYASFTVDVALPAVPFIAAVPDDEHARNIVTVVPGAGGAATTDVFQLERSLDGGQTWEPVRLPTDQLTLNIDP